LSLVEEAILTIRYDSSMTTRAPPPICTLTIVGARVLTRAVTGPRKLVSGLAACVPGEESYCHPRVEPGD
jgi:hypothetical protein